ncbi:hypothetical protein TKK_0009557 [Trichogramma kaykai]
MYKYNEIELQLTNNSIQECDDEQDDSICKEFHDTINSEEQDEVNQDAEMDAEEKASAQEKYEISEINSNSRPSRKIQCPARFKDYEVGYQTHRMPSHQANSAWACTMEAIKQDLEPMNFEEAMQSRHSEQFRVLHSSFYAGRATYDPVQGPILFRRLVPILSSASIYQTVPSYLLQLQQTFFHRLVGVLLQRSGLNGCSDPNAGAGHVTEFHSISRTLLRRSLSGFDDSRIPSPQNDNIELLSAKGRFLLESQRRSGSSEAKFLTVSSLSELVDLPPNKHAIDNRWVLRVKYKPDGQIDRFRARLVARGIFQQAALDYEETFSPVALYNSIRALIATAADEKLVLGQFDVRSAFLYGKIDTEIFMTQPQGFNDMPGRVCKLKRSLYG